MISRLAMNLLCGQDNKDSIRSFMSQEKRLAFNGYNYAEDVSFVSEDRRENNDYELYTGVNPDPKPEKKKKKKKKRTREVTEVVIKIDVTTQTEPLKPEPSQVSTRDAQTAAMDTDVTTGILRQHLPDQARHLYYSLFNYFTFGIFMLKLQWKRPYTC